MRRARLAVLAAVCSALACGGGERKPPERQRRVARTDTPTIGVEVRTVVVEPAPPASPRYGDSSWAPSPDERDLAGRLGLADGAHPVLSRASRMLAELAPEGAEASTTLVDAVAERAGFIGTSPRVDVVVVSGRACTPGDAACDGAIDQLDTALTGRPVDRAVGVGIAASEDRTRFVALSADVSTKVASFPRRLEPGAAWTLRGTLGADHREPSLEVLDGAGKLHTLEVTSSGSEFWGRVPCDSPGRMWIELLARSQAGPKVLFDVPVECGAAPPSRIEAVVERVDAGVEAAALIRIAHAHLNEARTLEGLPELLGEDRAAAVAAGHARDMAARRIMAHEFPQSGDVSDRFDAAEVKFSTVRENVAFGPGPVTMHEALMRSPGHRANILAADVTHVGIGIARAGTELYMAQNFVKY